MGIEKNKELSNGVTGRFLEAMRDIISKNVNGVTNRRLFGERIGEYQQNFSKMERGERSPTIESLCKLCTEFGYSAEWLLLGLGEKEPAGINNTSMDLLLKRVDELTNRVNVVEKQVNTNSRKPVTKRVKEASKR